MKASYPKQTKRKMDVNGELLLADGDWNLEDYEGDDGPVMYHKPCKVWIIELNRKYPVCVSCKADIPASMITLFTLMNWNMAHDSEYFVPFLREDEEHKKNGGKT